MYVKPCPMPNFPHEQLDAMRVDVRTLRMSPADLAAKYNLPLWTAAVVFTDAMRYRLKHIRNITADGGDLGWRF